MADVLERLAAIEVTQEHHSKSLEDIGVKVDELHSHFLQSKGAAAERREMNTSRNLATAAIGAATGAAAAVLTSAFTLYSRVANP